MKKLSLSLIILTCVSLSFVRAAETGKDLKDLSINGGVQDGKARLVIEARIQESATDKQKLLFATSLEQAIQVSREKLSEIDHSHFRYPAGGSGGNSALDLG